MEDRINFGDKRVTVLDAPKPPKLVACPASVKNSNWITQ